MIIIQYEAARDLVPGREAGEFVQIELPVVRRDRRTTTRAARHEALDGTQAVRHHNTKVFYSITTGTQGEAGAEVVREFLASVAAGEQFTFSPTETAEGALYVLSGEPSEARVGNFENFRFTFEVREI